MIAVREGCDRGAACGDYEYHYVRCTYEFTDSYVTFDNSSGLAVRSPQRTFTERRGDCSEMSLFMAELLQRRGIDATVIWGVIPGRGYHDTVIIHNPDKTWWMIDAWAYPDFIKLGDGLMPGEYII